jgi:CelD/BcsL family acetyltransferase involved in cellulose biosynthesis
VAEKDLKDQRAWVDESAVSYAAGQESAVPLPAASSRAQAGTGALELEALPDDLEVTRFVWNDLALSSGNIFLSWEWASTWWSHFGGKRPLHLLGARRRGGPLISILPLYEASRQPLRVARMLGHGVADQLGPVSDPAHRDEVASLLKRAASALASPWDLLLVERLPATERWADLTTASIVRRETSPVLSTEGSWEDFLASRSSNFRSQVRRRERKLQREWGVRFRLSDGAGLERDLEALFALHAARWGKGSGAFSPRHRAFQRDFAALALERGWLRLWMAEVDGRPIAAWYGFRFGNVEWYYQAGWDPAWARSSVGFVLLAHTIRESFRDGMREYRLLLGDEPYKSRFTEENAGVESIVFAGTRLGRAAALAGSFVAGLPLGGDRAIGHAIDRRTRH